MGGSISNIYEKLTMEPTNTIYPGSYHGQLKSKFHEKTKSDEV